MNCLLFRTNILKTQVLASHTTNKQSLEKINKCTKEINCCCCLTGMGSFFLMILNPARFRKWIKLPYKYLIEIMTGKTTDGYLKILIMMYLAQDISNRTTIQVMLSELPWA
jgi:hypothetical protein